MYDIIFPVIGADVNATNRDGRTALMEARDADTIQMLVSAGADVNLRDAAGSTVLHEACTRGNLWAVNKFIEVMYLLINFHAQSGINIS